MSGHPAMPDSEARRAAETTFDRNVVVVAGAGTGKTTLLVNRLVHLLMKEPKPLAIPEIVALTYTNKAATEMKGRLRQRLTWLARALMDPSDASQAGSVTVNELRACYGLSAEEIARRATDALHDVEKAQIGTVHSFAAHLLRLYPLEAGIDPAFREDDGLRFDESFRMTWDVWIDHELGRDGTQHRRWRPLLDSITLEQLRDLAYSLCSELIDIDELVRHVTAEPDTALKNWIAGIRDRAQTLLDTHDRPKRRKVEQMLAAAVALMTLLLTEGPDGIDQLDPSAGEWLDKDPGQALSDWEPQAFSDASSIIKLAKRFQSVNRSYFTNLLMLVLPLVRSIRASFARSGWMSFDGLLATARRLLWDHPDVRERLKRDYRALLIDEFQDTDPLQYEILLALGEQPGRHSRTWQEMQLEPGKLFIVGDPKQSIYAFRRADMEAFDRVVEKLLADGGSMYSLTTNFRSGANILEPVNDVFDRLFVRQPLVQPANVRLQGDPRPKPRAPESGVVLHVIAPKPGEAAFDAPAAARAEGEALARWLAEDILSRPGVCAGEVAFLFRKLTQADVYLDALRRYGIPYLIEGEKHFYRRQEVIDLMNVLRVLDHPHDQIALLGVLRSPLGGLTDREVYEVQQGGWFDYQNRSGASRWSPPCAERVRRLYDRLARLHRMMPALPLDEAVQLVFDELPILELAASSLHGEQAVANLMKVKQTAASLSDRPGLTVNGFIELMVSRLDQQPDEAESPLAEEASDAVQILTIHKAKGLEFPVVVLPALHQGGGREKAAPPVVHDWSGGIYGLSAGSHLTLGYARLQEKLAEREKAERRRVFYVGMTRAKDLLVLSGGLTARPAGETVFKWLEDIGEGTIGRPETKTVTIGSTTLSHRVIHAPDRKWPRRCGPADAGGPAVNAESLARLWEQRTARWEKIRAATWHVTPTSLQRYAPAPLGQSSSNRTAPDVSRLIGVVAHRILEEWDFRLPPDELLIRIGPAVERVLSIGADEHRPAVIEALTDIFASFGSSDAYAKLKSADILGREVPFIIPWGEDQVMEGVIDVVYRLDGTIRIADYKTDRAPAEEVTAQAKLYAAQAAVYREAATRCLGLSDVPFQLVFLRAGVSLDL
jgi:ATP-dependent helicase/nuclease subunit A